MNKETQPTEAEQTAEQYVDNCFNLSKLKDYPTLRKDVIKAMEEYATMLHFAYKEWVNDILHNHSELETYKRFSNEELWEIFLKQQHLKP